MLGVLGWHHTAQQPLGSRLIDAMQVSPSQAQ